MLKFINDQLKKYFYTKKVNFELLDVLTFIIPIRNDSDDRLFNISAVLRFLSKNMPNAEILVIEQDKETKLNNLHTDFPNVKFYFCKNENRFQKAHAVNFGAKLSQREYICMYDADVFIEPEAILSALFSMKRWGWRLAIPFNQIFIDIDGELRKKIAGTLDLGIYGRIKKIPPAHQFLNVTSRFLNGGIFISHRQIFLAEGGLNKKMLSYGWEDTELFKRFRKLNYYVLLINKFNLVHLCHERGADSRPNEYFNKNEKEYLKISKMSKGELLTYIRDELFLIPVEDNIKIDSIRRRQHFLNIIFQLRVRAFLNLLLVNIRAVGIVNFLINNRIKH